MLPHIPILSVKVREVMVIAGVLILYSSDWEGAGLILVVSQKCLSSTLNITKLVTEGSMR